MAVGGDDLRRTSAGERGEMLVEEFGGECIGSADLSPAYKRNRQQNGCGESSPCGDGAERRAKGNDAGGWLRLFGCLRTKLCAKPSQRLRMRNKPLARASSSRLEMCRNDDYFPYCPL